VFDAIIERIDAPKEDTSDLDAMTEEQKQEMLSNGMKCFLFDARFVPQRGVACLIKVMFGTFCHEDVRQLMSFHKKKRYEIYEVGVVQPDLTPTKYL